MDPKDPSIKYKWFDVGVLDYDPETHHYYVQKVNKEGRVVDGKGKPVLNGGKKKDGSRRNLPGQFWIPRVRLMFAAEDPQVFAQRVAHAFYARRNVEALIRYNLYIDCMPMDGVGELDQVSLKRMTDWAKGPSSLANDKE